MEGDRGIEPNNLSDVGHLIRTRDVHGRWRILYGLTQSDG
jgi:hypothetical protein